MEPRKTPLIYQPTPTEERNENPLLPVVLLFYLMLGFGAMLLLSEVLGWEHGWVERVRSVCLEPLFLEPC